MAEKDCLSSSLLKNIRVYAEINPDVEKLPTLREHLVALEAFIASPAHAGYVEACKTELEIINESILIQEPNNPNDVIELLKLYGMRRAAQPLPDRFKVAYDDLKARIEQVERETQNRNNP